LGNTTVTVRYGRKQTDKLGDGSFDSIELGGDVTLEVAEDENPFALYEAGYKKLAEAIEEKLAQYSPREIQAPVRTPSPYGADEVRKPAEEAPEPKHSTRGWIEDQVKTNTAAIQEKMQPLPGENIQPKSGTTQSNAIDEYGTPSTAVITANEAVMFQKCRVFEVEADYASNKNPFIKVRIGKRGEDGIPGQYTTARSFEADVIKQVAVKGEDGEWVKKIRDGDFVDVWGYFKPWKNNPEKFDLELQKIQLHED
jgi:hypothetical protein